MRLTAKLILIYLVGLAVIVGVFSWLTIRDGHRLAAADQARRAAELVAVLRPQLSDALSDRDLPRVQTVLNRAARQTGLRRLEMRYVSRPSPATRARLSSAPVTTVMHRDGVSVRRQRLGHRRPKPGARARHQRPAPIGHTNILPR